MLQIKDISKKYITGSLEQMALDGVSLNLRDNEFVAILGPSGSGKTTLLNIIGGLDRYDSGDLIINGVTTKRSKDRDWDSYRNHTIGFVFQSYNLIPHQTVLANVELALTIGGMSKAERKRRAEEALTKVGLKDHINKRPNQLSGGQMQRVAIARALVNDPDILLADEPTGALDSETSVQVMDLLKEVAKDRLVVMVTHNPELAEQYATRIVTLKDGKITSDSDSFEVSPDTEEAPVHRNLGKASMSFLTALMLSFNNLWTKKARTILVAFAGSIGIIGIALILSLSNGVNKYIDDTEEETLSEYPLDIQRTSFDLSSFMGYSPNETLEEEKEQGYEVKETRMVSDMFSTMDSNDLKNLKEYLDSSEDEVMQYAKSVNYSYNVTPWVFIQNNNDYVQVCPSVLASSYGGEMQAYSMMGFNMELFSQLPSEPKLYNEEYDVLAGKWAEKANEAILVLMDRNRITDYMLYSLGLRDYNELNEMVKKFNEGTIVEVSEDDPKSFKYKDFIGITYKVVPTYQKYSYDERYKVWTDKSDDKEFMKKLVANGKELTIVGVVAPKEGARVAMLNPGIRYIWDLTEELMEDASASGIVKDQLANRDKNVITGKKFSDEGEDSGFDMSSLFSVDEEAFANAFNFNTEGLNFDSLDLSNMDLSSMDFSQMDFSSIDLSNLDLSNIDFSNIDPGLIDMSSLDFSGMDLGSMDFGDMDFSNMIDQDALANAMPKLNPDDLAKLFEGIEVDITRDELIGIFSKILEGYEKKSGDELEKILDGIRKTVGKYFLSADFRTLIEDEVRSLINGIKLPEFNEKDLADMVDRIMAGFGEFASGYDPEGDKRLDEYLREYLDSGAVQELITNEVNELRKLSDQIVIPEFQSLPFVEKVMKEYLKFEEGEDGGNVEALIASFQEYINSEETRKLLEDSIKEVVDADAMEKKLKENAAPLIATYMEPLAEELGNQISKMMEEQMTSMSSTITDYISNAMNTALSGISEGIQKSMQDVMLAYSSSIEQMMAEAMTQFGTQFATAMMEGMSKSLSDAFGDAFGNMQDIMKIDEEALGNAFKFNMTEKELEELMTSLMTKGYSSYEGNLQKMGYADITDPYSISIYPKNFESKDGIVQILERYNDKMTRSGNDEKVIRYTDLVGTLMTSVTDIINNISYVLIAFVGISLVVSSIMIGVITYISVLERRKEIGILRAIGASKRNISGVFNAETFIIGLLAGLFGVGIARLLLIPANKIISIISTTGMRAFLPFKSALVLIALSVVLTLIGGIIPSRKAAKSDPVTALRTD